MDLNSSTSFEMRINTTSTPTKCDLQPDNPWCGQFGVQQIFEIIYLTILTVVGIAGNLIVIFSIVLAGKAHKRGNVFIINLAIADLIVTGVFTPTTIANVVETGNVLPTGACRLFGYMTIVTCLSSVYNLTFIALNRYWAIVRTSSYQKRFSTMHVYLMALFSWVWANLLTMPTTLGWSGLTYNSMMMLCTFDEAASLSFNLFLMVFGVFVPLSVTTLCYWRLFFHVRKRRKALQAFGERSRQKSLKREISLLKTLVVTVLVFVFCWTPFGIYVLFELRHQTSPTVAKALTWLGVINSAANFVIYGLMNKGYRKGYKHLFIYIFCYKQRKNFSLNSSSEMRPMSYKSRKQRNPSNANQIASGPI